ncbi:MAG: MFS transporter [archaeon GB-1867-005]|nr:MFS transporter [Candidatus Culexmicrobium cathedralense]
MLKFKILILTWVIYSSFYLCRVNFPIAMPLISGELGIGSSYLGVIASGFFITYAIGQVVNGYLNIKWNAKSMLYIGILGSSISTILFGLGGNPSLLLALWVINGYFQSIGWPATVKIVSVDVRRGDLGKRFGLLNTSWTLGHAASWLFTGFIVQYFGWRCSFIVNGILFMLLALTSVKLVPEVAVESERFGGSSISVNERAGGLGKLEIKVIVLLALAFFISDGIRYGLITYLPSYFFSLEDSALTSTLISLALPLAGSIGMIIVGWLSDRVGGKLKVLLLLFLALLTAILLYDFPYRYEAEKAVGLMYLIAISISMYGSQSQITSAMPVEISGEKYSSFVAGLINAVGSAGAFLFNFTAGFMIDVNGYAGLFETWSIMQVVQAAILVIVCIFIRRIYEEDD